MHSKTDELRLRLFDFSLKIITLKRKLIQYKEFDLASQLFRSATSIGANYEEACVAVSKPDFIAKTCISSKEASETVYWLKLIEKSSEFDIDVNHILIEALEIKKIFRSIVKSAQSNPTKRT
jgi:four helix bundle protein